jgi:amino acid adenylation domain-containing protein
VWEQVGRDRQHVCSATSFEPFRDAALDRSLVDRFAEQVERHHDCLAVVDGELRLTYGELDARANGVAHAIAERAGEGREPVALVVRQGAGYASAVLGTLKSGRPYVPLDPADPVARTASFVADCGAPIVLADPESHRAAAAAAGAVRVIRLDQLEPRETAPGVVVGPDTVAYVFFTSGSTGEPKGVYDTHRNVLHNILRYTNALEIAPSDRLTLLQGPAFSGCVSSQLGALLNGAASFPFRLAEEGLLAAAEWLRREQITVYHSVPSIFRALVGRGDRFPGVRVVRLEGDRARWDDVEFWRRRFEPGSILANGLGTTETGLARQLIVRAGDPVGSGVLPVGHAVRDMDVLVVGDDQAPLAAGEAGEIAVRSAYLAPGYWNRPDLTDERFVTLDGGRAYLTGDLGLLREDGCLEYLGRRDGSLKVLGNRVEPSEIERELMLLDGVREAVVTVREGRGGEGRIVAHVVPGPGGAPSLGSVRAALARSLPSYMLPTGLVELDALPVGANGKVDRAALAEAGARRGGDATERTVEVERRLLALWADALELDGIGVEEDFFALGGDSLAAAVVLAQIESETGRSLPPAALVSAPTVRQLAAMLQDDGVDEGSAVTVLRRGGEPVPLTLLHGNSGNTLHYARLVDQLEGTRPLWALEYPDPEADVEVDAIVSTHLPTLAEARPDGPYLLAGFCYGGVIAHELGRRLAEDGHEVHLALLGITPLEFPTVVSPGAYRRWERVSGTSPRLLSRVRYHAATTRRLPPREMPSYVTRRVRNVLARARGGSRDRREEGARGGGAAAQSALSAHRPGWFPGRPLVVLHRDDSTPYIEHPERDWAGLGTDGVDVVVVPGASHAMLEDGAGELAGVLRSWAETATGGMQRRG